MARKRLKPRGKGKPFEPGNPYRWRPGDVGNPEGKNGRPAILRAETVLGARDLGPWVVDEILKLAKGAEDESVRLQALKALNQIGLDETVPDAPLEDDET